MDFAVIKIGIIACIVMLLSGGCARAPIVPVPLKKTIEINEKTGLYHKIVKGETLWRISKEYGIELDELISANNVEDAETIKTGQMIFIPLSGKQSREKIIRKTGYPKEDFAWPVKGKVILTFGDDKGASTNKGIDIQAKEGDTILASRSGKVIFSDEKVKGYGKTIIIDHGDNFQTIYAHNMEIMVKIGEEVSQFTPIASVGSSGRGNVPYLHFEIRKGHNPLNPFYYLPQGNF